MSYVCEPLTLATTQGSENLCQLETITSGSVVSGDFSDFVSQCGFVDGLIDITNAINNTPTGEETVVVTLSNGNYAKFRNTYSSGMRSYYVFFMRSNDTAIMGIALEYESSYPGVNKCVVGFCKDDSDDSIHPFWVSNSSFHNGTLTSVSTAQTANINEWISGSVVSQPCVKIKWTDPPDISTNEPVPCTWAGTVVVRKEGSPPRHRWDGTLIVDSTTRDAYSVTAFEDDTIEGGKTYYYGIFPYHVALDDASNPIKHYRYTKCVSITTTSGSIPIVYDFDYDGETVQTFIARQDGNYLLEAWGASGGHTKPFPTGFNAHSLGGYSRGVIQLSRGDKLYLMVGGEGATPTAGGQVMQGGVNGGGNGGYGYVTNYMSGGGGGGATHIATVSRGVLANYDQHRDEIILVAGGGGGTAGGSWGVENYPNGANCGGGFKGKNGYTSSIVSQYPYGGTQDSGYQFGVGENGGNGQYGSGAGEGRGGGGGGWYGGHTRGNVSGNGTNTCGGGGSGYINTSILSDANMAGYYVEESSAEATKTNAVTEFSENAESNKAKQGNGYARITFINS